jgi:hypothetical protein
MHLNLPFGPVMSFDVQTGYARDAAGVRDRGLATPGLAVTRCMARGTRVWASRLTGGGVSRRLSPDDAHALLREVRDAQARGSRVVTFNGTTFDFPLLGAVAQDLDRAAYAALDGYDPMISVWIATGRLHSLAALATVNKIRPLLGTVSGDWYVESRRVPDLWAHARDDLVSVHAARQCILVEELDRLIERDGAVWIPSRSAATGRVRVEVRRGRAVGLELRELLGHTGATAQEAAPRLHELAARMRSWPPRTQWLFPYLLPMGTFEAAARLDAERRTERAGLRGRRGVRKERPRPDPEWPNG